MCLRTGRGSEEQGHLEERLGVRGRLRLRQEGPPLLVLGQRQLCRPLCLATQGRPDQVFALLDKL